MVLQTRKLCHDIDGQPPVSSSIKGAVFVVSHYPNLPYLGSIFSPDSSGSLLLALLSLSVGLSVPSSSQCLGHSKHFSLPVSFAPKRLNSFYLALDRWNDLNLS